MISLAVLALLLPGNGMGLDTPSAGEIVARCQHAYDSVKTLEEEVRGTIGTAHGTAHIFFQRPGRLRITGTSMFGGKPVAHYDMLADGHKVWVKIAGPWKPTDSAELGIASVTGISANAGMRVPALLMHTSWGALPRLTAVTTQQVNGHETFRLHAGGSTPSTVWIDRKTYFLVKTAQSVLGRVITVVFGNSTVNQPIPQSRFVRS